ncbi:MAG: nucleoside 2-deoxyribosyltransferase domain-containing protein [Gammaproteobacteria bacterium]|nr:nucleoside 2-deoxyribosyltransferase domain-containing protein [Gammaproteobacteria bacterium]
MKNKHFKVIKPTDQDQDPGLGFKIFLAGSIDQGKAVDWQTQISELLSNSPITVFNPRRDDWDSSWVQDISNDQFRYQVEWELDHMDLADKILMYYDPKGQAPITLLEMGLHAQDNKLIVCCPDGYWRKGNVQITCKRYQIPLYNTLEEFIDTIKSAIG